MATLYAPRIVTDGLVLCLDAANRKSYPGSGTAWNDLSGNNNTGTLTNGPTFDSANGGSIVFDGVNDFVQTTLNSSFTAMTLMGFIKRNGNQVNYAGIFFSRGTSVTGLDFYSTTNNLGYHWNDQSNTYTFVSNLAVPNTTWCMITMSVTSTAATLYVNTSSVTNTVSHGTTTINDLKLGQDDDTASRFMNGNIATTLLYNRALSAAEVLQNYNATRSRFGI
jgi:hypothetical protein